MGEAYVANAERKAVRKIVGFDNLRLILRILLFVWGGGKSFPWWYKYRLLLNLGVMRMFIVLHSSRRKYKRLKEGVSNTSK